MPSCSPLGIGVAGAGRERHIVGTNLIRPFTFGVEVPPGKTACQTREDLPAATGGVRVRAGSFDRPGPALSVALVSPGHPTVHGAIAAGWKQGDIVIDVPKTQGDRLNTRLCFSNRGSDRVVLAGEGLPADDSARIDGAALSSRVSVQYVEPRATSWWGLGPELASRVATVRAAMPGSATLYVWALLALVVVSGSLVLVVREGRR